MSVHIYITYEETGEVFFKSYADFTPVVHGNKNNTRKAAGSVAFFTLWGSWRKKVKGLGGVHRTPEVYVTSKHTSTATLDTFYTTRWA